MRSDDILDWMLFMGELRMEQPCQSRHGQKVEMSADESASPAGFPQRLADEGEAVAAGGKGAQARGWMGWRSSGANPPK
jgi:hypothetical protein